MAASLSLQQSQLDTITASLDAFIPKLKSNPALFLNSATCPQVTLYCPAGQVGKIWSGMALAGGVSLQWGQAGAKGQHMFIPLANCAGQCSVAELKRRALSKVRQGYRLIPHKSVLT